MKRKTLLSWSSGKDSAWALQLLQQDPSVDVAGLFCTVNKTFNRVAMHAVRVELLKQQAEYIGLPLHIIEIPYPCSNTEYADKMSEFIGRCKQQNILCMAFGDLFLDDVRQYRENNLSGTGITPLFPLWGLPTDKLATTMIDAGLRARITCVDPKQLTEEFAGRQFDHSFLSDLPDDADPCGENGEFHSFVFDGPMFKKPLSVSVGETVQRDGFVFCDLLTN